jgi:hypothetical protein
LRAAERIEGGLELGQFDDRRGTLVRDLLQRILDLLLVVASVAQAFDCGIAYARIFGEVDLPPDALELRPDLRRLLLPRRVALLRLAAVQTVRDVIGNCVRFLLGRVLRLRDLDAARVPGLAVGGRCGSALLLLPRRRVCA